MGLSIGGAALQSTSCYGKIAMKILRYPVLPFAFMARKWHDCKVSKSCIRSYRGISWKRGVQASAAQSPRGGGQV